MLSDCNRRTIIIIWQCGIIKLFPVFAGSIIFRIVFAGSRVAVFVGKEWTTFQQFTQQALYAQIKRVGTSEKLSNLFTAATSKHTLNADLLSQELPYALFVRLHCLTQGWRGSPKLPDLLWCHAGSIA